MAADHHCESQQSCIAEDQKDSHWTGHPAPGRRWLHRRTSRFHIGSAILMTLFASPAVGRDAGPYVGIEGGLTLPRNLRGGASVDAVGINSVCLPGKPLCEEVPEHFSRTNVFQAKQKQGADLDAIVGWDLGPLRVEGELGWKRLKSDGFDVDQAFLNYLSAILHRPLAPQEPGAPGAPALVSHDFDAQNARLIVKSAMVNALADVYQVHGTSFYAGGGIGGAWAKGLSDHDRTWAAQVIAGVRTRMTPGVQLGLKYRYFRTGSLNFAGDPQEFTGNRYIKYAGGIQLNQQDTATVTPHFRSRLSSHSLLATLSLSLP